jgi:hypothetical protein
LIDVNETNNRQLESNEYSTCSIQLILFLVTDMMKRESAIAEDFWRDLFK